MFATVRSYSGSHEFIDALIENESEVKRLISSIDGFKAYYLIRTEDGAASVSVYDTQAGIAESDRAAAGWVGENLPQLQVAPPQITEGEVVINF
jgi:heme-degrading monooxygenase HmoA